MPKVDVYNIEGQKVGDINLSDEIFAAKVNDVAMHSAVVNILANARQGTQSTKTRAEVRGGGRKPWRQKGTGRARHGSIRSPLWVGGGVAHGPKPRNYSYKLPKKVKRLALKSALTTKVLDNNIIVLDELKLDEIKTKKMANILKNLNVDTSALIVTPEVDRNIVLSARNIEKVKTTTSDSINTYDILRFEKFIVTKEAVAKIEEVFA
ncbi:MAG: 50S ribosomal protein L4 [Clostridiaceae bacterium]|nr:50S ribosomal protein L4 [Clostridiaceae bacterium]